MQTFRNFVENTGRPIVSVDFDGVLHRSVRPGTTHPISFANWKAWEPNEDMHAFVKKESVLCDVVVVSKRDDFHQELMWKFIHHYELPIQQIYTTNNEPKLSILTEIGAIRHYDDDPKVGSELKGSGIQFILVDPHK